MDGMIDGMLHASVFLISVAALLGVIRAALALAVFVGMWGAALLAVMAIAVLGGAWAIGARR